MLAYSTSADLPLGLLIYAKGESDPATYTITNANKTIELAAIDLEGQPEDILKQVKGLACRVERHAGRRHPPRRNQPAAVVGV